MLVVAVFIAVVLGATAWYQAGVANQAQLRLAAERAGYARSERLAVIRAELPALLTLEQYPLRRFLEPYREPLEVARLLDEFLELDPENALARFYRANNRSQCGDLRGARKDLRVLRRKGLGSPVLDDLERVL